MQLYEGLPIITNKMPVSERKDVPHHLLGCIGLSEETWTVGNFVANALAKIREIRSRGRLPILVGGTHYYTQSLLFHDALAKKPQEDEESENGTQRHAILDAPTKEILEQLRRVDPVMADRWHPNDRRKIQRSLEIYLQTGRPASEIYQEQRERREETSAQDAAAVSEDVEEQTSLLRTKTLILWVHAAPEVLSSRLDARVDKMLSQDLLSEVRTLSDFYDGQTSAGHSIDTTRGIWVAIGYKEFLPYQQALSQHPDTPQTQPDAAILLLAQSVEKTKAATRQYAKRQIRWLRLKLANAVAAAGAKQSFFLLDGTDLGNWDATVSDKALTLVDAFVNDTPLPDPKNLSALAGEMLAGKGEGEEEVWVRNFCEVCGVTTVSKGAWDTHVKSRKHRRGLSGLRKRAVREGNTKDNDGGSTGAGNDSKAE